MTLKHPKRCLKWLPLACMHIRHDMDWQTCSKIPSVSRIVAVRNNHATRSISELTGLTSIVALKEIHVPLSSNGPERTFDDSVAVSLDIFAHTTEQQHVHIHWLGRR
ncbi:hypothetical protein TNCV_831611 [Trichonephila clavipes]|nr:hypothetical protein TNCV_831611 [Trichonephila clavipes]